MRRLAVDRAIPREVADLFHTVRKVGNAAAHHGAGTHREALATLKVARQIGIWFHRTFGDDPAFKQTLEQIGRPKVQELHDAVETGEHGLFVTLGGFTSEARTFERSKPNLRLIDGNTLIELIYAHYDRFETRYKMLLPLKRTYIPGSVLTSVD